MGRFPARIPLMHSVILWEPTLLRGSRWTSGRTWSSVVINIEWVRLPPSHRLNVGISAAKWLIKKSLNKLYIFFFFLLPLSISKQISIAVLIVFQGLYPCTITIKPISHTAWKVSKYGVISGPHFAAFGLNTKIYSVNLRIQSEYSEMRSRSNSLSGHF